MPYMNLLILKYNFLYCKSIVVLLLFKKLFKLVNMRKYARTMMLNATTGRIENSVVF